MISRGRKKKVVDSSGPLKEGLLPDPVNPVVEITPEPMPNVVAEVIEDSKAIDVAEPIVQPTVIAEKGKNVEYIPVITPVTIEHIDIPGYEKPVELPSEVSAVDTTLFNRNTKARVFMSGVDNHVNSSIRTFLQKLGLQTFASSNERRNSEFIVEQFQQHSNQFDFAIVVLSADEILVQKRQALEQGLPVTKPETIFELGFLVGKLGKQKVAVFYEEDQPLKRPTEYFDLLYTAFDANGHWQKRLLNQLISSGIIQEASVVLSS